MEAGAANRWRGRPRGRGVRLRDGRSRVARNGARAKIPKRYEHCDFESYVTDLTDGRPGQRSTRIR